MRALLQKQVWEAMLPYRKMLQSALDLSGGTHTFEDVVQAVSTGDMQFWPAESSALVTQIVGAAGTRGARFLGGRQPA